MPTDKSLMELFCLNEFAFWILILFAFTGLEIIPCLLTGLFFYD